MQQRNHSIRVGVATLSMFLIGLPAWATGPSNQVLANPSGNANLNSVVQLSRLIPGAGDFAGQMVNDTQGSGSIIDRFVVNGVGFFTVLTADHVIPAVDRMAFANGNAIPNVTAFPIHTTLRTIGANGTDTPDMALALIRYGAPDAFFNNVATLSLINGAAITTGSNFSVVGFGNTGTIAANVLTVSPGDTSGTKRYQNNVVSARPAVVSGIYSYQGVSGAFNSPGGVAGEGGTFGGDSGAPYFSSSTTFDPSGGLPTVRTDTIAAVHTLGLNVYNSGDEFTGVDVFTYRGAITTGMTQLRGLAAAPEPGTLSLLAIALIGGIVTHRRRRAH